MDSETRQLIFQAIDQTISAADFERLQDAIEQSDEVRQEYLRAVNLCESLGELAIVMGGNNEEPDPPTVAPAATTVNEASSRWGRLSSGQLAIAATLLVMVAGAAFLAGRNNGTESNQPIAIQPQPKQGEAEESLIAGHATLRRSVGLSWPSDAVPFREGDVLPDGLLKFDDGIAEIDFFCGATLIVEGPATLDLESDWSVRVVQGRLRANVPPAARGFVVKAADSEIVDLGTEFALEVGTETARVEVIDGEVELRGGRHDGDHLLTGQGQWLRGTETGADEFDGLSTVNDVLRQREDALIRRLAQWQRHSQQLSLDDRLIAWYPIVGTDPDRVVRNAALTGSDLNGQLIGPVNRTPGRFGLQAGGLEFDRLGARVRTRIDGEFQAFTFACWARIDSLENVYNALFMGDGYENGEPHWQIREDGRLMFSVMVDDTQDVRYRNRQDGKIVRDAGLHRVYMTEPFWDRSKSGQWFHIAAVYDPAGRRVTQYVNGQSISDQEIEDKFFVDKLRIGPAEIGNWGQPFRETPWFAVRNLNGIIDELAIFNAALKPDEVQSLYEQGKPLGY